MFSQPTEIGNKCMCVYTSTCIGFCDLLKPGVCTSSFQFWSSIWSLLWPSSIVYLCPSNPTVRNLAALSSVYFLIASVLVFVASLQLPATFRSPGSTDPCCPCLLRPSVPATLVHTSHNGQFP